MTSEPGSGGSPFAGTADAGLAPAAAEGDHDLRMLFGRSSAVFASMAGPAHMLENANATFFTTIGGPERARTGVPLGQLMPELVEQGFIALLDRVYRTGVAYTGREVRVVLGEGSQARETFFDFTYEPRLDSGSNVTGVRLIGVETTQVKQAQRLAAEHRALLEQIARQAPLPDVLDGMARVIEELAPEEVLVSVLLADPDGLHLRHGAAPSLPAFYNEAIDGIATGDGVGSCGTAAHRRQPVIVSDIGTNPFWEDFRDLAVKAGLAACWSTPILARDGSLLGTFAMYHRVPRSPQEADLALARVFASTAALAVERHLAEEARRTAEAREKAARDDLAFLLDASTHLSTDLNAAQTFQRLAQTCMPRLAPLCAVDVVEEGRVRRISTAAPTQRERDLLATHIPVYDAVDDAVARVLASGTTEIARRTPTGPGPWHELKVTGYLCVPLLDRGRAFGTMTLLSTGEHTFDGHTVALAEELARRASSAARNARQYTHRAALARDLQAGLLLPDLPRVPGAEVATYYHPAGEGLDIGGDFYDVFPLEDGSWAFMLGDVCGRGAIAATTTALVRHTVRAVAPLLPGPTAVVEAINRALINRPSSHGTGFVTLIYGRLTPTDAGLDLELVRAGHGLPLHLDAGGRVHPVEAAGSLLGIGPHPRLTARHLHLRPHESLVLHTDGITEARRADGEQFGEDRLAHALTDCPPHADAQAVLDALTGAVHAFTGDRGIDDDQAVLVLTATHPAG
ncbi:MULTISPECIES: GAF domain-containing SpoIIE family protein phosphatase [unclassified Streptomyces]|uniref:GAF domain-containing SpoIIE family protein phosphatase n=1 Tax=unclassified Streptomyces TaxID=2593676 RepID=UPI000DB99548|nr:MULTISPECIES: GAF domain-containing SpoIIE family protein phosphatase [unclassified Streptomyces]MYT68172.1 SpoIIE family protein phosphatase [Streptomyces sp. SID8367]RAJ72740.1 GAF domain-containing protein [Streptomyces sp. PsTaAH-137]